MRAFGACLSRRRVLLAIGFAIGNEADDVTTQVALGAVAQGAGFYSVSSFVWTIARPSRLFSIPVVLRVENKNPR